MRTWVPVLLGCILVVTTSHAQSRRVVYQWRDANGVTHFSDYPQPGARQIVLNGAPQSSSGPSPAATTSESSPSRTADERQGQYDALEIVSPYNEQTFFGADEVVTVSVQSQPAVRGQDRLVTYLDGKPIGDYNQTEHALSGLVRGAHTLQSTIYGSDGAEKIRSEMVTFFMRQPSIANPRNQGPAVRPPPRPQPR